MEKLKRIFSLILATVLIGLFITEPVIAFAGYDIKDKDIYVERSFDGMYMDNKKTVEGREGIFKLDLKKVSSDLGYNYALLISWRVNKNTKPGNIFSITLPQNLQLNIDGKIEEERGVFLGEVLHEDKAIFNLFYSDYKLNFHLTEDGSEISKTKDLFATDILLNLNIKDDSNDKYLSYIVENYKGMTYELIDAVDEISYEKLFKTEDEVIIEEPQGTEILETKSNIREIEIKDEDNQNPIDKKPLLNLFTKPKSEEALTEDVEDLSEDNDGVLSTVEKEKKALLETQNMEDSIFEDRNDNASRGILEEIEIESESIRIRENQDFDYDRAGIEEVNDTTDDKGSQTYDDKGLETYIDENPSDENKVLDKENLDVLPQENNPEVLPEVEQKGIKANKTQDLQIRNLTEIVSSPKRDLLLITKDTMDKFLSAPKFLDKSDLYTLRKTVNILDVRGMTRQEEQVVGDYLTDSEGKLVFEDLQDGHYTFIKEGEGPVGRSFTIKEGIVDYNGTILLDNILDISEKTLESNKSKELNKDISKEEGLITIEVEINDSEGKAIDPKGAIYSVYRLNKGVEEKIDTLTWENASKIEKSKDAFESKSDILQMLEESKNKFENTDEKLSITNEIEDINFKESLDIREINAYPKEILQVPVGTYILKEEKPPIGYEKTLSAIELNVAVEEQQANEVGEVLNSATDQKDIGEKSLENNSLTADDRENKNKEISPEVSEESLKPTLDDRDQQSEIQNNKIEGLNSDGTNLKDKEESKDTNTSIENKENSPTGNVSLKARILGEEKNLIAKVEEDNSLESNKGLKILYQQRTGEAKGVLNIETVDAAGNKLFYGGTSSAEIGNLRDKTLNHDATYGVYKLNPETGNYEPLNIYDKMVYDTNLNQEVVEKDPTGAPIKVNYKNGKFGVVTLDNLPSGDYIVKEIKSVFQYAFKNLAMKFTVDADGKITDLKDVKVALADYEKNQTDPTTGETARKKLTYRQKMDWDSKRIITAGEVTEEENVNITEKEEKVTVKTVSATYHKGNLKVKKVDREGNPIPGVTMELHGHDANRILRIYRVITDENGIAEFKDLNVPSYHLLKEVEAPEGYALPNHQWMIYFGEGTWVEFDDNNKPVTEHIPLQISNNQVYAIKVQVKPIIKLNPQETRQVVENDKYRPLVDQVTGASIAPKNWFQFLGINNPEGAPKEDTKESEAYWSSRWNDPDYFKSGIYEKNFNASKDELFYNTRERLKKDQDNINVYNFTVVNNPRAKVTINKKDDKGNILPGATFEIYKADNDGNIMLDDEGNPIPVKKGLNPWKEVSGLAGRAIFDNLPEGKYVIRETRSPGGYRADNRDYKISVDGDANIKFEDRLDKTETLYEALEGTYTYETRNWLQQIVYQDIFTVKSKITSIDPKNKTFEEIFYLRCYDNVDNKYVNLYTDEGAGGDKFGAEFYIYPYARYFSNQFPSEYRGEGNSATTSIDTFETFMIRNGTVDFMPDDMNPDLSNEDIYTSLGEQAYNPNDRLGFEGIDSPNGVIIKIKGSYDGDKPIFTQGVLTHTKRPNDNPGYSTAGIKITTEENIVEKKSNLDFEVINIRDTSTSLDNKGTVNLSKLISETDTILKGAKFGLYVGKWDQINPGDTPFAELTTRGTQIGNLTVAGKKVNLQFKDIPPGVYTLKELDAPPEYEKTLHTWTVRVFPSGVTLVSLNPTFEEDPTITEPVNVNDKVHVDRDSFKFYINREPTDTRDKHIFETNKNEFFKTEFSATLDKGIRRGNYFTIDLDKKLSYGGTIVENILPDIKLGNTGYVLATGELDPATNQIKYTFTEIAENLEKVSFKFAFTLLTERKIIQYNGKHTFDIKIANDEKFTTDEFTIEHSVFNNGIFWLDDYYHNVRASGFINTISYERGEVEMVFYMVPGENASRSRELNVQLMEGIVPPIEKCRYEIYEVLNPGVETGELGQSYYRDMPKSFGIDYGDTTKYNKVQEGYIERTDQYNGKIKINDELLNKYLIAKVVAPFKVTGVDTKDSATIRIISSTVDPRYGTGSPSTTQVTSSISIKPSEIFSQTELTTGEVLAFNKKKNPMYFTLLKRDMQKELITKGDVNFKLEVADDYPDSTPVPEEWGNILFDLKDQLNNNNIIPLKIDIPDGMSGEYILTETSAPKGYFINGLRYRIKIDSRERTVKLISVKDSNGNPVEYKFKLPGSATDILLTPQNPAPLYKEETKADGTVNVDTQIVSIDILNPQGEYPKSGGFGTIMFYILGMALMALALNLMAKRKRIDKSTWKGGC